MVLGLDALGGGALSQFGGGLAGSLFSQLSSQASLGGVTFAIIDSREQAGRRVQRLLFPQEDVEKTQVFQDFGTTDTPITINGVIVGDDYVIRVKRLRKRLLKKGKLTLVHPWWGRLKVRLVAPAEFSFNERQIRVAHFSAQLVRDPDPPGKKGLFARITDTINDVLEKADALIDEVTTAIQSVLSPLSLPLAMISAVNSAISEGRGMWDSLTGQAPQPIKDGLSGPLARAAQGVSAPTHNEDGTYGAAVASVLAAPPVAVAQAVTSDTPPAIAPASAERAAPSEPVTGQDAASLLCRASQALATGTPEDETRAFLNVAARCQIMAQLAPTWAAMRFTSTQDAEERRDQLIAALDAMLNDVSAASQRQSTVPLSGLFDRLRALRQALLTDASAQIGTLPDVMAVPVPTRRSLFALCYALAGDDVSTVQPMVDDAVTRNSLRHPALAGPGMIELLEAQP